MRKLLSLLFFIILFFSNSALLAYNDSLMLGLDQSLDLGDFRKINAPYPDDDEEIDLSREGLDHLNYSGSAQFSEKGLSELKEILDVKDLIIVDLRRESHGFINGLPVSWMDPETGWSNLDLTTSEIIAEENDLLKDALKEKNIIIYKTVKDEGKKEFIPMPITVNRVITERNLCAREGVGYVRIPVSDHMKPQNEEVDEFIKFFKTKPSYSWVHFHCKGGIGRTTTFLIMVDMLNNAKNLSFDIIVERQMLINNASFLVPSTHLAKQFSIQFKERLAFLEDFYNYCRDNQDNFETSWSKHINLKVYE